MKTTKLTPSQLTKKKAVAAKYSKDELQSFSKSTCYSLIKGCVPKTSSMTKDQLIEAIMGWTELERRKAEVSVSETEVALKAIEMFDGSNDFERLSKLWYKAYPSSTTDAATAIIKYLNGLVNSRTKKVVSVINNDYAGIKTVIKGWFDTERDDWARVVISKLHEGTVDLRGSIQADYTTRRIDKSYLDNFEFEPLLEECICILENPDKFSWEWTSFALALTSGRRATEIHGENRQYEIGNNILTVAERDGSHLIGEYNYSPTLAFTGAAKVKGRDVGTIQIPLLVESKLWLDNWNNLPEERKGCDAKRMKSISRALSEKLKAPLKNRKLAMYKDSRDVYCDAVMARYDENNFKSINKDSKNKTLNSSDLRNWFASAILNHKIEAGSTRSYGNN